MAPRLAPVRCKQASVILAPTEVYIGLIKAQGAEKRGLGFPNGMCFRKQIGAQFFGWNIRLEVIGKLHRYFYALPDVSKNELEPDAERPQ
jgi:hypothetical protein